MSRSTPKIALALVAVLALAACAAREKPAPGTSGNPVPSASSADSSTASETASTGPTLTVLAVEPAANTFTFDSAGVELLSAGPVQIAFQNSGTMAHELRIVRIRDGNFGAYRVALVDNNVTSESLADEVAGSSSVDPGKSSTFGAELSAGTYALVCLLNAPDGKTFAQHGMIRELRVAP